MQLTSKEIEKILRYFLDRDLEEAWQDEAYMMAAHAIFERVAEGVVWDREVVFEIDREGDVAGWCEEIADYVVFFIDRGELILGQPFRVTVTTIEDLQTESKAPEGDKEEEDGS